MAVVSFEAALEIVLREAVPRCLAATESVTLLRSVGRVLATPLHADRDQPPFDRSTRDGFAVRAGDAMANRELRVIGQVAAGQLWQGKLIEPGEAIQIMTGAPVPKGADAVVMLEHILRSEGAGSTDIRMQGDRSLVVGENIVPRGEEAHAGARLLSAGTRIGPAEIALAAACGAIQLDVYQRPKVAIVSTGDELVELGHEPGPQQIRNSNSFAIAAMVEQAGGTALPLGIARDQQEEIRERIVEGRRANLLVLSGGVSMGEYDLVEDVLAEFGAEFFFTGVAMQPGRPVVFGRIPASGEAPECCFFGLPGNPISTQVTFHCFVELFLRAMGGETTPGLRFVQAALAADIAGKAGLTRLLPARVEGSGVCVIAWQGSGDLAANARANGYAELLPDRAYRAGELIRVLQR